MIQLIASDLDGTLLQKGTQSLTPDVIKKRSQVRFLSVMYLTKI